VFAEEQHSADDIDALAAEVGDVQVVTLFTDALGPEGSGAETYTALLRKDATLIAEGLAR
jgi:zinc/manganese transport system substrate-binding protein